MTATVLDPAATAEVAAFAAAVRTALDDLALDDRDELVDGLEAELLDRVADSGPSSLGDPAAYAAELRAAAGLPPRASQRPSTRGSLLQLGRGIRDAGRSWLARHPFWQGVGAFLAALRPAWWVLRALVAYQVGVFLLSGMGGGSGLWLLPIDGGKLLMLALLVVVSVQFGRGRWLPLPWMRAAWGVAHAVLILAAPFVASHAISTINNNYWTQGYYAEAESYMSPYGSEFGTSAGGSPVFNVYAYDAQGNPVPQVRLYDQDGQPLNLVGGEGYDYVYDPLSGTRVLVPSDATPGSAGWNVYPLAAVGQRALDELGWIVDDAPRIEPSFPFAAVPALVGAEPGDGVPEGLPDELADGAPEEAPEAAPPAG